MTTERQDFPEHLNDAITQWGNWNASFMDDDPTLAADYADGAILRGNYIMSARPLGSITLDADINTVDNPTGRDYFEILWAWQLNLDDELHEIKLIYLTRDTDGRVSTELFAVEADTDYSTVPTQWDKYNDALAHPTAECPEHGTQDITGGSSTGGPDPYHIDHLACGHHVICMGPGEPMTIVADKTKEH